ncbi:MAG: hypothetical protein GKR94_15155 [Gammaproteobacteria bacterium]|nr:hypothetical protein [Gammaproteobacteria bacterium]
MANPLSDKTGEVRELTAKDFAQAMPASKVLPDIVGHATAQTLLASKQGKRGAQKALTKQSISIRLSPNVVNYFKATGKGWQTRINDVLSEYIASK